MDQKNIGQVSGVDDRERQDFSGLNSSSVEQVPDGMGQMTSSDFGAEQVPTGLTQDEAVARLNQMFEAQGMPGANGFDRGQMAMGQMAMQAQMNGVSDQMQLNGVLNQTQMNSVPGQAQMNSVPEEMRIGGVSEGMQTGGVPEWVQMNSASGQGQFEQVNPMQIHSEQIQGFENANLRIEQEKNLETERAEVEQGDEFSDEGGPKSDLGKIVTVGTRTFEDGKLIGTDLPKARDRDGLEKEILKEVEKTKKIKSPTMQYRQKRMLSAKLLLDRYGRILGQDN
ncbi:hypothetical protein HG471_001020 [Candidatus Saccharibacteria bacterium]|nr:hypothetical protein [Candidatus Saccharibacteria bacterium]